MQESQSLGDQEAEIERARQLLERTVRFLKDCIRDPQEAMAAQDPHELIEGLRDLGAEPRERPEPEQLHPGRTIQIRPRRSA